MIHARAAKGPLQIIVLGLSPDDLDDLRSGNIMITTGGGLSITLMLEQDQDRLDKFLHEAISEDHDFSWDTAPEEGEDFRKCKYCGVPEDSVGADEPCNRKIIT